MPEARKQGSYGSSAFRDRWCLLGAFLAFLISPAAWAGPFDLYGSGAKGTSMAGAQTALSDGPTSLYYNVASLTRSEPGWSIGAFSTFGENAQILLHERPRGYGVPDLGPASPALPSEETNAARSDTTGLRPLHAAVLGGTADFGIPDLRLGFLVLVPISELVSMETHFADERERIFSNQLRLSLIHI